MLLKKYIGIDLGTDNTRIYLKGKGVVIDEPSIVAFNQKTNRIIAVGRQAKNMVDRTPNHIAALRPIDHGIIADFDMAKELIQMLLKSNIFPWSFSTHVIATTPTNLTEVERKSVIDLLKETGINSVSLLEQPLAAAFSSHLSVYNPTAYMVVDIGAGTTDMAIISMNGIVVSRRIKIAGNYFNGEIIKGIKDELKLHIGQPTAEEIKINIAVVGGSPTEKLELAVRGRDVSSGLPREAVVKDSQVKHWIMPALNSIITNIKDLIEITPPELVGDIYKNGIYLCGGGSLLKGIDSLIAKEVGVEVNIMEDTLRAISRGTGIVIENFEAYSGLLDNLSSVSDAK